MKGKKSFVLYTDLIHTVGKLPNEKAGELFKLILEYVNDNDPQTEDLLLQIAFEPIKQQLKRDLVQWAETIDVRRIAGRIGGLKSGESRSKNKANEANASKSKQSEANEADSVNDNVTVNVNEKKNTKGSRVFVAPSLESVIEYFKENGYNEVLATKAFNHYSIANWHDTKGNPVKVWKQKFQRWFSDENGKYLIGKSQNSDKVFVRTLDSPTPYWADRELVATWMKDYYTIMPS